MTYTTEQVVELYSQYRNCKDYIKGDSFEDWLMKYESSQTPVKGQLIWVRDNPTWYPYKFSHFNELTGSVVTYSVLTNETLHWDEYSLTDPNL